MLTHSKTSFVRYQTDDPAKFCRAMETLRDRLAGASFKSIDDYPAAVSSAGFVSAANEYSTNFTLGEAVMVQEPVYIALFRRDERRVSRAVLNKLTALAEAKALEVKRSEIEKSGGLVPRDGSPADALGKNEREFIANQEKDALRARTTPVPALTHVVFHQTMPAVLLTSTNTTMREDFGKVLRAAFEGVEFRAVNFEVLTEGVNVAVPDNVGLEFLTWLFTHPLKNLSLNGVPVSMEMGESINLSRWVDGQQVRVSASGSLDAIKSEMANGAKVTKASVTIAVEGGYGYTFRLNHEAVVSSLETPAPDVEDVDKNDKTAIVACKVDHAAHVFAVLDVAFSRFVHDELRDA